MAIGCGDNIDFVNDNDAGPSVDAAPRPDAAPTVGTCGAIVGPQVGYGGGPINLAGIPVFFNNADGSLIGTEYTDVKGAVSRQDCGRDTTVSVLLEGFWGLGTLFTYAGVNPGDTVYLFGEYDDNGSDWPYANVNVSFDQDVSGLPGVTSVDETDVTIGCNGSGDEGLPSYLLMNDISNCSLGQTPGDIDVLSWLYDNGQVQGYSFLKDVPLSTGTSMTPANNAVTMPPWTPGNLDNAYLVINTPHDVEYMEYGISHLTDGLNFAGDGDDDGWNVVGGDFAPPVLSMVFRGLPDGFGETSDFGAWMELPDHNYFYPEKGVYQGSPFARTVTLDLSDVLPSVAALVLSGVGTSRPIVNWVTDADMDADIGVFYSQFYLGFGWVNWFVMTPHVNDGSFVMPVLPAEIAEGLSEAYPSNSYGSDASFYDASWLEYRDFVGAPGFDPTMMRGEAIPYLPPTLWPTETEYRFRGSAGYYDD